MSDTFSYFAYGSNMLSQRLAARCASARFNRIASVSGYKIGFSKRSIDKSGKATLVHTGQDEDVVIGVVFDIAVAHRGSLDDAEGSGYCVHEPFPVTCVRTGTIVPARTYIAGEQDVSLLPYDWYLALVLAGVREHGMDEAYAAALGLTKCLADPNPDGRSRLDAISALQLAGHSDYRTLL